MIDARTATGIPCITTCPTIIPREFLTVASVELLEWQQKLLAAHGFLIADDPTT